MFGIGMGTVGFCPGPGMINSFNYSHNLVYAILYASGSFGATKLLEKLKVENSKC